MTQNERIDRYLAIVAWARKRYTKSGWLTIRIGERATRYTRIECAAFAKYLP